MAPDLQPRSAASRVCVAVLAGLIVGCRDGKNKSQPAADVAPHHPPTATAPAAVRSTPASANNEPPAATQPAATQQIFRREDDRVVQNSQRLQGSGIHRYESERLILYSDLPAETIGPLPRYADRLFEKLTLYFGPLPASRSGSPFQATGCLMKDPEPFRRFGLLTDRVPPFEHGRHLGYEFWVNDQESDYYRRHLVLHEFTHCFMACVTGTADAPPAWYMEGMAEYFATHRVTADGIRFGIIPENKTDYPGLGRITFLNQAARQGQIHSLAGVLQLPPEDPGLYPWSWAACWVLATHPATADGFRAIGTHLTRRQFETRLAQLLQPQQQQLEAEWYWIIDRLCDGFQMDLAATRYASGKTLGAGESARVRVSANRGWQSTEVATTAGAKYRLSAAGQFVVGAQPEPWVCEAQGVSVRYVRGHRLGCLMATIFRPADPRSLAAEFPIADGREIDGGDGVLYLRINDEMNSLRDNSGELAVTVQRIE